MGQLSLTRTPIPGLLLLRQPMQHTEDGWFKENWHREKMAALGMPDLRPVQENLTHVVDRGTTRGFHAEPWDRLITLSQGRAFGAWVDLRAGDGFGRTFEAELDPTTAVFVPRGVGNAHQVLEDGTTFSYLLSHHWTPQSREQGRTVHLFDPALRIAWPIGRDRIVLSHRDASNPLLADAEPMPGRRVLVVGTETPLGRALAGSMPDADGCTTASLLPHGADRPDLSRYDAIVNVHGGLGAKQHDEDGGEGWGRAVTRAQLLTDLARRHAMRYVHISADCVFAQATASHGEDAPLDLSIPRGRTAAVGEALAATVPGAIMVRTGWVVDDAGVALRESISAARHGAPQRVESTAPGRLTYVSQLAAGIAHLLTVDGAEGTYNLTGDGRAVTPAGVVRRVFEILGADGRGVVEVDPQPDAVPGTVLSLDKIKATGFRPGNAWLDLIDHIPGARPKEQTPAPEPAPVEPVVERAPYKVLFVCTANICRSAYADVVANMSAPEGVEFSSAGVKALVGEDLDPPMARMAARHGEPGPHAARQLTRALMAEADLVVAMAAEHRRFILDEWPMFARKTYVIGHVARQMGHLPEGVGLEGLVDHLWRHRTPQEGDDVADPYGRGEGAAEVAAGVIDGHLAAMFGMLEQR